MRRAVILRGRGRGRRAAFVHPGGAGAGRPSQHASREMAAGTSRLEGLGARGRDGVAGGADGGGGIWCTGWGRAGTAGGNGGDGGDMRAVGSRGEGRWGPAGRRGHGEAGVDAPGSRCGLRCGRAGTAGITARQGRGAWRGRDIRRRDARGRDSRAGGRRAPWPKSRAGARFGGGRPRCTLKD
jgi:hypothetical protein